MAQLDSNNPLVSRYEVIQLFAMFYVPPLSITHMALSVPVPPLPITCISLSVPNPSLGISGWYHLLMAGI